nr:hypothetical protein B0A51_01835 [Rachicladosporium sp. CCFEE 5018]
MGLSGHADPSAVVGVTVSFTVVAVVAVALRLYSRLILVRSAGKDDIAISIAAIMTIGLTVAQCYQVKYGMGRHVIDLSLEEQITSLKPLWVSIVVYQLGLFFVKLSILLQYLRIFPYRAFRLLCWTLIAFLCCWSCWTVMSSVFLCTPVAAFWDADLKAKPGSHCFNQQVLWFTNSGVNIITDILTAALPLPFLNQLQLPKRQKYALMVVFALGGFTCIISILRLGYLAAFTETKDITWDNPLAAIWSSLEVNIGILCSCLPTLKTLVLQVFPRIFSSGYAANTHVGYGSGVRRGIRNRASLDALGKGLSGRDQPSHSAFVRSGRGKDSDTSDEIEFATMGHGPGIEEGIQVTTVLAQEVEKERAGRPQSEDGSIGEVYAGRKNGRTRWREGI